MKKEVPYHPELRELIPSLGFESSTDLFIYLRQCNSEFGYDRVYTKEDRIEENIIEFNILYKKYGGGFIFVMDVPNTNAIEVIHLAAISKDDLIKYLKLKAFS